MFDNLVLDQNISALDPDLRPSVSSVHLIKTQSPRVCVRRYGTHRWAHALTFSLTPNPLPTTPRRFAIVFSLRTNPPPIDPVIFLLII